MQGAGLAVQTEQGGRGTVRWTAVRSDGADAPSAGPGVKPGLVGSLGGWLGWLGRVMCRPWVPSVSQPMAMSARSWSRLRPSPVAGQGGLGGPGGGVEVGPGGGGGLGAGAQVQLGRERRLRLEADPAVGRGPERRQRAAAAGSRRVISRARIARSRPGTSPTGSRRAGSAGQLADHPDRGAGLIDVIRRFVGVEVITVRGVIRAQQPGDQPRRRTAWSRAGVRAWSARAAPGR